MSESIIGDESWNQMTEAEKTEVVRGGRATLRQLTQGLLDGPEGLRDACRDFLAHTGTALEELPLNVATDGRPGPQPVCSSPPFKPPQSFESRRPTSTAARCKFGLPEDFTPRLLRSGRMILLEENIYRLPDGRELVPSHPTGPLGRTGHLYALVTATQHEQNKGGSIYVRTDGRIFDYSVDSVCAERELFDTGFTMFDLERTGRYVVSPGKKDVMEKVKRSRSKRQ